MTGTAREAARELWQIYGLPVIAIPPNRPCVREQWPDRFFLTEAAKWEAMVDEIERLHATGRPLLIGTRSVQTSEHLWRLLTARGLESKVLNATRLQEEAATIAVAGERGRITIATNMAGRGTDIKLGRGVAPLGGLHVIASERHESGRVDRQLFGRSGRQGDPGSAQTFVSLDDELVRRYLSGPARRALDLAWQRRLPGRRRMAVTAFKLAQSKAQAVALKQRKSILRSDLWLEQALSFAGGDTV
jgi:preprotein translocase subunit SecA